MSDASGEIVLDERLGSAATLFNSGRYAESLALAHTLRSDETATYESRVAAHQLVERVCEQCFSGNRAASAEAEAYHLWYYDNLVWMTTRYVGISVRKSPSDMWNYQEIISELKPSLVIEFGTYSGASALFFSHTMTAAGIAAHVLTVDIDPAPLHPRIALEESIETMTCSSADPCVAARIAELRLQYPGPVFVILDSDHRCEHVLAEMLLLKPLLTAGDYLVVEDANINGHPVLPNWGAGPFEAIVAYEKLFAADYQHDAFREDKFGFAFATNGFLRRM